ncbi:MAG: trimethylamine methyltransferase family protein [Synergistaceae bacterium]|jgi:trimethylamine--corrinoid protein Co-methyltransferase|nr:trimethylamine methyltransferase family protein [Synergistaceae bacterium]
MYAAQKGGQLRLFSDRDVSAIHEGVVRLLEEVGVQVKSRQAFEIFEKNGAVCDPSTEIVKLPRKILENIIKTAPSKITIYGRDDKHDAVLEKNRVHFGTGGTVLFVNDFDTGEKRKAIARDVRDFACLTDALENLAFYVIHTYPSDVPTEDVDANRFYWALTNTSKPVMGGMYTMKGLKEAIQIAETIAGGADKLRERPFASFITLMVSPLVMDPHYTDFLIEIAKRGLPVAVPSEPLAGATSPVTIAGTIAINLAETLMGLALAQMITPGCPALIGTTASIMDMKTGTYSAGAIESSLINVGIAQMAQYYDLPLYATGGQSDSKTVDAQAGYESACQAMALGLSGANWIHDSAGLLENCTTVSYEKTVIDNEILSNVLRVARGIDVTPKTLAIDVIKEVGPAGNFLVHEHTVENFRKEFFLPTISDRWNRDTWVKEGSLDAFKRAHQAAENILRGHRAPRVDPSVKAKIRQTFPGIKGEDLP